MTLCTVCGKKVPKKRTTSGPSEYSGFFCSNACHWKYNDQMMKMMRETELEVEDELKREIGTGTTGKASWTDEALDALDQAAASATNGSQSPEEIAAKFLGTFAGKFGVKFATGMYSRLAERVKNWTEERKTRQAPSESAHQQQPGPQPTSSQHGPHPSGRHPQQKAPSGHQGAPTPGPRPNGPQPQQKPRRIPEPADLDDLPLEEQRVWYLRRFYLPPTATLDDVKTKYKVLARKYHPDNKATGNVKLMAIINVSKQKLEAIERELQPVGGGKKKKSKS